jgi:hypothetical protein
MEGKFHVFSPRKCFKLWKKWAEENLLVVWMAMEANANRVGRCEWLLPGKSFIVRCGKLCWSLNIYAEILSVSVLTLRSLRKLSWLFRSLAKVEKVSVEITNSSNFLRLFKPSNWTRNWIFPLRNCVVPTNVFWVFPSSSSTSNHHRRHFNLFSAVDWKRFEGLWGHWYRASGNCIFPFPRVKIWNVGRIFRITFKGFIANPSNNSFINQIAITLRPLVHCTHVSCFN